MLFYKTLPIECHNLDWNWLGGSSYQHSFLAQHNHHPNIPSQQAKITNNYTPSHRVRLLSPPCLRCVMLSTFSLLNLSGIDRWNVCIHNKTFRTKTWLHTKTGHKKVLVLGVMAPVKIAKKKLVKFLRLCNGVSKSMEMVMSILSLFSFLTLCVLSIYLF